MRNFLLPFVGRWLRIQLTLRTHHNFPEAIGPQTMRFVP